MDLLEKAIGIAVEAHRGQTDRYGAPYILHPLRVMARVETTTERIIAILHDVVEDTDWTFADLKREGFPQDAYFAALDPRLERVVDTKLSRKISSIGECAGSLTPQAARWTGLKAGTAVAVAPEATTIPIRIRAARRAVARRAEAKARSS